MNFRNRLIISACIGVIFAALSWLDIGAHLEELSIDLRLRHRPARECAAPVRLVVVDDDDIAEFGQWPIPRAAHADVLQILQALGSKHVALDILFTEASRVPAQDEALQAVLSAADFVTLGYQFEEVRLRPEEGDLDSDHFIAGSRYGAETNKTSFLTGLRPELPFAKLGSSFGNVNAKQTSADEIVRHIPLFIIHQGKFYPGLAMQAVIRYYGLTQDQIRIKPGVAVTLVDTPAGTIEIPINEHGQIRINYGLEQSLSKATRSYLSLYGAAKNADAADTAREHFADTAVIVGNASSGNSDVVLTPMGRLPGVAVQAMALENLLSGRHLRSLSPVVSGLAIIALPILLALFMRPLNAGLSVLIFFLLSTCWAWATWHSIKVDLILPLILPVTATMTTLLVILPTQMLGVYARFSRYIPTTLRTHLLANQPLSSGSRREELTIFFSDIRGFTAWVEETEPDEVATTLNEYLSAMADLAEEYGGTLDKFVGDCVMIFFGAPAARKDHAEATVRMAWAMQQRIDQLGERWSREGSKPIQVGMGINTDFVTFGNFGSHRFQDFTAIGRGVNLAARIESVAPGGTILLSWRSKQLIENIGETRLFAEAMFKGIAKPVPIYELVAVDGQVKQVEPAIWRLMDQEAESGPYPLQGLRVMLNTGRITRETEVMAQDAASPIKVAAVLDERNIEVNP